MFSTAILFDPMENLFAMALTPYFSIAVASLWEWSGSATTKPTTDHLQIVVKLNTDQNFAFDLEDEGDMMMSLKNVPSKHIVKILAPPKALRRRDCARERLAVANWQGKVKRLVMEYCSIMNQV